jgi:hypothetical protein
MNAEDRDLKIDGGVDADKPPAPTGGLYRSARVRFWVNWALALLTVLGAAFVMLYWVGAVMSTAACSEKPCQHLGPNGISPDVLLFDAPVVAALTVIVSFFTARRRWGIVVPVFALALLVADVTILAVTVAQ